MKWLFTFAVVTPSSMRRFRQSKRKSEPAALERAVTRLLDQDIKKVAYFRSIMDGWDPAHRVLQPWFSTARPETAAKWSGFVRSGILILKGQKAVGKFGSRPRQIELRALKRKLDAYALHAMIDALYDALEFVSATRALLVVAARLVGPSMGDDEYAV